MTGVRLASGPPILRPDVLIAMGLVAAALLAGAGAIYLVDRWRKRAAAADLSADELTSFRAMFERGELTEDEYNKVRSRAAGRFKESLGVGPKPPAAPPAPPAPPPPAE